jgi:hypothetical protein
LDICHIELNVSLVSIVSLIWTQFLAFLDTKLDTK